MKPTGNAGGVHNLIIEPGNQDLQTLVKSMGKGLFDYRDDRIWDKSSYR